jgi:hypothetical protein
MTEVHVRNPSRGLLYGAIPESECREWEKLKSRLRVADLRSRIELGSSGRRSGVLTTPIRWFNNPRKWLPHLLSLRNYSGAGIVQPYSAGLRTGWSVVRAPVGARNFSLRHRVEIGSGAHPASYIMGSRGSFPAGNAAGKWSWPLTSI